MTGKCIYCSEDCRELGYVFVTMDNKDVSICEDCQEIHEDDIYGDEFYGKE